jgi:hypothetical protein
MVAIAAISIPDPRNRAHGRGAYIRVPRRTGLSGDGRPWIHVTEPDNGRALLNAALASLGRPGLAEVPLIVDR